MTDGMGKHAVTLLESQGSSDEWKVSVQSQRLMLSGSQELEVTFFIKAEMKGSQS